MRAHATRACPRILRSCSPVGPRPKLDPVTASLSDYGERTPLSRATTGNSRWLTDYMEMWLASLFEEKIIWQALRKARYEIELAVEYADERDPVRSACLAAIDLIPSERTVFVFDGDRVGCERVEVEKGEQITPHHEWQRLAKHVLYDREQELILNMPRDKIRKTRDYAKRKSTKLGGSG